MEIADLFVVNKADREGADRAVFSIRAALDLRSAPAGWATPVLTTVASRGDGVADLAARLEDHLAHLSEHGGLARRRRQRLEARLRDLVRDQLWLEFRERVPEAEWRAVLDALIGHTVTPHQAADRLIALAAAQAAAGDPPGPAGPGVR